MNTHKLKLALALGTLTAMAGMSSPAQAALDLAQKPLFLGVPIKPSFIMTLDDSGSMQWDVLSPNQDGELVWGRDTDGGTNWGFFRDDGSIRRADQGFNRTGDWLELFAIPNRGTRRNTIPPVPNFGFSRSPEFNAGYYNPGVEYGPWLNYDGTPFESMDTPAEWQSIKVDPRRTDALRYDLTGAIRDRSDDGAAARSQIFNDRNLYAGIVLRAGWQIRARDNQNDIFCPATPSDIAVPGSGSGLLTLTQDYELTGACRDGNSTEPVDVWIAPFQDDFPEADANGELFNVRAGMTIPAGTTYWLRQPCMGLGASVSDVGVWTTTASDIVLSGSCDQNGDGDSNDGDDNQVAFAYYAPTYYLSTNTSPDGNVAPITFANQPGGPRTGTTPGAGTLYRYEIRPGNYATYAEYEKAMTNFANWWLYYRTRNLSLVAALTRSLNDVNFMRIGYFLINDTNDGSGYDGTVDDVVMHEMSDYTDSTAVAGRKRLYEGIIGLPANGSTPNAWAVTQIGEQFKRTAGTTSPVSDPPITSVCQFNAGMLFTDGYHNQGRPTVFGNEDDDTPLHGVAPYSDNHSDTMADIAAHYYKTNLRPDLTAGLVPVPPGCAAATPDPSLDCNRNLHMNLYGITLGASGEYFGVTHFQDPDTFAITPDVFQAGNAPAWKGFANDARSSVDDLWHATLNSRGQYINATSPDRISQAMNAIIESINNSARRSAGTAASGARRAVGFTAYIPEFDPNSWTGDLKAYSLLPTGELGPVVWSAVEQLPDPDDRNILVSRRKADDTAYELQPLTASSLGADESAQRATVGLADSDFGAAGTFLNLTMEDLVDFLRGDETNEGNSVGQFRRRLLGNPDGTQQHRPIGDILGSQPEVLDRGSEGYSLLPESLGGRIYIEDGEEKFLPAGQVGTYSHFVATTKAARTPILIVGANDGMVHGFNASLSAVDRGAEVFAVIPAGVLGKMGNLARRDYNHTYFADGSPRVADACIGDPLGASTCSWKSVAVMGMGTGGRSVMALDVTDPVTSFDEDNLLWEITAAQDSDIGFVVNRPRIFIAEDGKWYAAFGNGLNSTSQRPYLYIVDLKTGDVVRKIALGNVGSDADPNGAVSVAAVDGDGDDPVTDPSENNLLVDTLYVNDFHGKVWKIDMSSSDPTAWNIDLGGGPLYTALAFDVAERADQRQFMTGGIDVAFHPIRGNLVYFGTGRYVANGDQNVAATPQVQTFYGIWDDPLQGAGFGGRASLQEQRITGQVVVDGVNRRTTSEEIVDYTSSTPKRGWFIDLYQAGATGFRSGERVLGEPRVEGGAVIFTAFQPIGSECNPGGKNWLYAFNATSGANALTIPGCNECGGTDLNPDGQAAPPTLTPPIVVDPPPPDEVDTDGDGVPDTPADENCLPGTPGCPDLPADGSSLPGRQCVNNLSVLLPNAGLSPFTQIACGRQAWRQIQ